LPALDPAFLTIPIAHRGYHDRDARRIENSPSAFRAALDAGYGIELDLQLSGDGVAMVFHDYELDRLTDLDGKVGGQTAVELGMTSLTGSQDFIQTLPVVLRQIAGRVPVLIEIKDQGGALGPDVGPLEQATAKALEGYAGPAAVMSFNPHSVAAMAEFAPDVPRGIVTMDWEEHRPRSMSGCGRQHLDRPVIHSLKERDIPVLTWTIRSEAEERAARRIADNITFEGYAAALT